MIFVLLGSTQYGIAVVLVVSCVVDGVSPDSKLTAQSKPHRSKSPISVDAVQEPRNRKWEGDQPPAAPGARLFTRVYNNSPRALTSLRDELLDIWHTYTIILYRV